jgi:hypothetical protein
MSTTPDFDRLARAWLDEGPKHLSDFALEEALKEVHLTRQRRALRVLWRIPLMPAVSRATGIAAVALLAVVGAGGLIYLNSPKEGGAGGTPSPFSSPAVTSPAATTMSDPDGPLEPGTYAAHPLPAPNDSLSVTFTVPEGWGALEGVNSLIPTDEPGTNGPGGVAIQFIEITTLNGDPCHWSGADDDVETGQGVDDLVAALRLHTFYEASDPVDVTIGGFSGKRVDIVNPTEPFDTQDASAPECDENVVRLWDTTAHGPTGVYVQGPANRWQANILDVEATRFVVVVQDYPGTSPADRAALDAIVASLVIKP